ncbi:MAG: helix-hairpin-helix domain-containing protein [Phyllobacteriaceae bacterium]|jgi:hypothetical protein|nr:helix-hairpin-helix domain-containing protein [Phyllobacteriaceae bacterium]
MQTMEHRERRRLSQVRSIGPRMIAWLETAGYRSLEDFEGETPASISFRVEAATGVRLNRNGNRALENLIAAAQAASGQTKAP